MKMRIADSIHDRFMNLSFKYKVMLLLYSIIILISVLIGSLSYHVYSKNLKNQISNSNLNQINQIKNSIDFVQKDVNELSTFICLNNDIQDMFDKSSTSELDMSSSSETLKPLTTLLASKSYISFIILYGYNGFKYYISSDSSYGINDFGDIKNNSIVKEAEALKGHQLWIPLTDRSQIFIQHNKSPKIAMMRTILNTNTFMKSGFMVICLNISALQKLYTDDIKDTNKSIAILDNKNNLIAYDSYNNEKYRLKDIIPYLKGDSGSVTIPVKTEKLLVSYSTTGISRWKVIYMVPLSDILKSVQSILYITITIIIFCLLLSLVLSMYVSNILTSPIKKLLTSMRKVKNGNFKEKVDFKYSDEIGMLGNEYNDMIDNINQLIDRVYKLQLQEKEAELKALEAQINPHFLYNTLDGMYWKAQISGNNDIAEMIYSLSRIFRLTLNRGAEFITIANEKEFVENYLILQKMRFKDKLMYNINFSDDILKYKIPKLILQPFIENSIIHGVECTQSTGILNITAYLEEDMLMFIVSDNGKGIEPDKIASLLSLEDECKDEESGGYAIGNINKRINFYYGTSCNLSISSTLGIGTTINLRIPKDIPWNIKQ